MIVYAKIVGYIYADEHPDYNDTRSIKVWIDRESLAELECSYNCEVRVRNPGSTNGGTYILRTAPPHGFSELEFQVEIKP